MARERYVTDEAVDPRERFSLYVLCDCPTCEGRGKGVDVLAGVPARCPDCRGEGRTRVELASCESAEAVGVALITLAREGEWLDADGNPCAFGLLDRLPECETCGGDGRVMNLQSGTEPCGTCKGSGVKPSGTWLILPWLASPRNVTDAARTLAKSKTKAQSD
jgi:hypothetical protein